MPDISTSSTAVDLSRLPAPTVVEQLSFEAILAEMIADLQARMPEFTALVESDPVHKLLQVAAYRELLVRQNFNDRARRLMLAYADGSNLDQLAALVGVERLVIEEAEGDTPAVMESDEALRRRVVLAPDSFSVAGPEAAYVFHALSADGDVLDASAYSPPPAAFIDGLMSAFESAGATVEQLAAVQAALDEMAWPGDVIVTVLSREDDGTASSGLLEAVEAVVNDRPIRPLTDRVTVQSAEIVTFTVAAALYIYSGPDTTLVTTAAQESLDAYLEKAHRLGYDITLSALYAALHVPGVQRVVLTQPVADIPIDRDQAPWCTDTDISFAGVAG